MFEGLEGHGLGWVPDHPDFRDYTVDHETVQSLLAKTSVKGNKTSKKIPISGDLRSLFPPIEHQDKLGSCTAQAAAALYEYFEKRAFGRYLDVSRLFLYKVSRNLLGWQGDTGAQVRAAMGAMVLFGVPPEKYCPYDISRFDDEPSAFLYSFAQNYKGIRYFRLDATDVQPDALILRVKRLLVAGIPSMFGFTVYGSIAAAVRTGEIPFPVDRDPRVGGHAVAAVGWDDKKKIAHPSASGRTTTGAFLIRNSWGTGWGMEGYGYLPYEYVLAGLALDWWSLLNASWIDTGNFGL